MKYTLQGSDQKSKSGPGSPSERRQKERRGRIKSCRTTKWRQDGQVKQEANVNKEGRVSHSHLQMSPPQSWLSLNTNEDGSWQFCQSSKIRMCISLCWDLFHPFSAANWTERSGGLGDKQEVRSHWQTSHRNWNIECGLFWSQAIVIENVSKGWK